MKSNKSDLKSSSSCLGWTFVYEAAQRTVFFCQDEQTELVFKTSALLGAPNVKVLALQNQNQSRSEKQHKRWLVWLFVHTWHLRAFTAVGGWWWRPSGCLAAPWSCSGAGSPWGGSRGRARLHRSKGTVEPRSRQAATRPRAAPCRRLGTEEDRAGPENDTAQSFYN